MSTTSATTPIPKSRLTKNKRRSGLKPGPRGLTAETSKAASPACSTLGPPSSMLAPAPVSRPPVKTEDDPPSSSPTYYRNYDIYTSSPYHIPNSQAPIPGREVYWDYDTPQSRKYREAFVKEFEESDSPVAKKNDATPKLRMVPKSRVESLDSLEQVRKGEQAMKELMELCREAEERDSKESVKNIKEEKGEQGNVSELKFDDLSMESEVKEEVKNEILIKEESIMTEDDMFADDFDLEESNLSTVEKVDEKAITIENDDNKNILDAVITSEMDFGDDDDSFLLTATQVEVDYALQKVASTSSEVTQPLKSKLEREIGPAHYALNRVKEECDVFGDGQDDSFDLAMSQIVTEDTPSSPVLKRKRKCMELAGPSQPTLPPLAPSNLSGIAQIRKAPVSATPVQNMPAAAAAAQNILNRKSSETTVGVQKKTGGGVGLRKYGSFDSQEQKKSFTRMRSEPNIGSVSTVLQPVSLTTNRPATRSMCTKEDIERKKREAMARRQQSQLSQAQTRN